MDNKVKCVGGGERRRRREVKRRRRKKEVEVEKEEKKDNWQGVTCLSYFVLPVFLFPHNNSVTLGSKDEAGKEG